LALPSPVTPRPASARSWVFEQLRNWIEDGTLAPGEVIRDTDIAARLGVSRTPVREALQMLERLNAVETAPSRSTRVTEVSEADGACIRPVLAALHGTAAAAAAASHDDRLLDILRTANGDLRRAVHSDDPGGTLAADIRFHNAIVDAAANPYLKAALEPVELTWRRVTGLYFAHPRPSLVSARQHDAIVDAIAAGDAALARELTEVNILGTPSTAERWSPRDPAGANGGSSSGGVSSAR